MLNMASHLTSASLATLLAAGMATVLFASAAHGVGTQGAPKHLHFYMHDSSTGPKPTTVLIANGTGQPLKGSGGSARFGDTMVMDDRLTEGPTPASRVVGRAQGFYVTASQGDPAVLLTMNVLLADGPYNGSSLAVMGRNNVMMPERELAVVGGTGVFRMATGYVLWKTASWRGGSAVLELDAFVYVSPAAAGA
ncbi:hypothetical protein CFC21_051297 [Triticum aestivum]|uniref:Dirigent protein n=4 Tax=Triticum TaxID=4564 RepID=A0A3B6HQA7_WHEAT|nr:hypothetical protein CFC21_051297 [Triticum aestivum]